MAALVTVADVESKLGRDAEDEQEEAQWQFYIDTLSAFINNYVDVQFGVVTNETRRFKADYDGTVKLPGPVIELVSVLNARTGEPDFYHDFDMWDKVFYLSPEQVVDITWSYGIQVIPEDIQLLVLSAVLAQIQETSPISLRSYQVGDVREEYRDSTITQLFGTLALNTLLKYTDQTFSINTGGSGQYPDYLSQGYLNTDL